MSKHLHFFSKDECFSDDITDKIGIRGIRAKELAELKMPILPGAIVDSDVASTLAEKDITETLGEICNKIDEQIGKKFGDPENPAIFKIVISPSMEIISYPSIHTIGLTDKTIGGFSKMVGEHFAYHEYANFLIKGTLDIIHKISTEKHNNDETNKKIASLIEKINLPTSVDAKDFEANVIKKILLPEDLFLIKQIYIKDGSNYVLNFDNGLAKNAKKMLQTLTYMEHRAILEEEYPKYIRSNAMRIINGTNYSVADTQYYKNIVDEARAFLPKEFFEDAHFQLEFLLKKVSEFLSIEEMDDDDSAIMIQPMVYGNYGKDSCSGKFYTRDIITGAQKLQGSFYQETFDDATGSKSIDINEINPEILKDLALFADNIECSFQEIRQVKFTVEKGRLWIIEQNSVMSKSTQAEIKSLLYLIKKGIITEEYMIEKINPSELSNMLHPVINQDSIKELKVYEGGITGAPGAARGKVYFSTESLLEAHKKAIADEQDKSVILCLPATFAEDVKAIEVSTGVLSCEGGYSAHASVVARQYGKVSLVNPEVKIDTDKKTLTIGEDVINEGEYITLDVPYYGKPRIIKGKADLIEPDPKDSGLLEFLDIINKNIKNFHILGNGDSPKDAMLIKKFGGEGIGLCRTEHMWFLEGRINIFREMIMASDTETRKKSLDVLQKMQMDDFYNIFKTMYPYPVTIRLLDAPLHEFAPHTEEEIDEFFEYYKKKYPKTTKEQIKAKIDSIAEVNPMLGHRGCRIAISYPEIYEMQISAIFEAAYKLQSEGINVVPEIMIPIVMNTQEIKYIKHGKKIEGETIKGIIQTEAEIREKLGVKQAIEYKVGTMIELPAAVLAAGDIAQYAEFFSFGTNDLTQTTHGLSRDDFNSFMPDYSKYDIIEANPFQVLTQQVKEMISIATQRGRLTRPDLKIGLCGEQGADPRNLEFLRDIGLNYASCSSYSIPIAKLAVAKIELQNKNNS